MSLEARFRVAFEGFTLDVDVTAPARGITALFGRSGSGKTTMLRCMAGLERVEDGRMVVDGAVWQEGATYLPPHRRPLGYVSQEPTLFPHMSVHRNLEYGLRRLPAAERRVWMEEVVELLGLAPFLARRPHELSGGQRQRVAVGRALLTSPRLLLMDEPLASLDTASKAEILPYLEHLHETLSIPVVYVTHAMAEVTRLADYLLLLEEGMVRAEGPLNALLTRDDLPLAHAGEATSVLEASVSEHDETFHLTHLAVPGGRFAVSRVPLAPGAPARVRVHARDVSVSLQPPEGSSIQNVLPATVGAISDDRDPAQVLVRLDVGGEVLLARLTRRAVAQLELTPGMPVYAQVKSVALAD